MAGPLRVVHRPPVLRPCRGAVAAGQPRHGCDHDRRGSVVPAREVHCNRSWSRRDRDALGVALLGEPVQALEQPRSVVVTGRDDHGRVVGQRLQRVHRILDRALRRPLVVEDVAGVEDDVRLRALCVLDEALEGPCRIPAAAVPPQAESQVPVCGVQDSHCRHSSLPMLGAGAANVCRHSW